MSGQETTAEAPRDLLEQGRPLFWTGRGASFALAEAAAAALRARGAVACAVAPSELGGLDRRCALCVVSRSGWVPARGADLLVCERPDRTDRPATRILCVPVAREPSDAWFPLAFVRAGVRAVLSLLNEPAGVAGPPLDLDPGRTDVLVFTAAARSAQLVLRAAHDKLGALGLVATELDELGHGLHSRVALAPRHHALHLVELGPVAAGPEELGRWCREVGVALRRRARPEVRPAARPLVALEVALAAVERRCAQLGLDPARRPIASSRDGLRGLTSRARDGGVPCK